MCKKPTMLLLLAGTLAMPSTLEAREARPAASAVSAIERRVLAPHVAEYFFKVRVGSGPFDEIGLHRVVKETAPFVPARASRAVLLAHGDVWNFRAAFLTGAHPLPVFLAQNGIDVWGIDFRWTFVPSSVTDFSFMADWGIEQDARDLGIALGVARLTRAFTGSGFGKIHLLGWSRGGQIGYAYLSEETRLPPILRQVRGFIPVDIYLKTDVPQLKDFACQRLANTEAAIAAGQLASTNGVLISALGTLAVADPTGPSILNGPPFNLDLDNRQAGLLVGEATFVFFAGLEPVPVYHFNGGTFDGAGEPSGLLYSNEGDLFAFEQAASPFQPNREVADGDEAICEQTDVGFDDHLDDITVPVLYIGAGGGFGDFGLYTTTLLGSTDVTSLIISKVPPAQRLADYGHADLFLANDAQTVVWGPLLSWIQGH